tara:strand:- start:222 stop:1130 length:909 start_codon:yes stop_codon:yes gene_type:complete
MPQTNKTANMLNFDNTNHKTKYISQFTNKDCRKKETLENYEQTMYVTTLNVLYNLKHGLGIFDKKNGDILQNIYNNDDNIIHIRDEKNFIAFNAEFTGEDGEVMNIYEYLGIQEPVEQPQEEIEDDISIEEVTEVEEVEEVEEITEDDKFDNLQNQLNDILKIQKDYNKLLTETINEVKEDTQKIEEIENEIKEEKNKIKLDIEHDIRKFIKKDDISFIVNLIEESNKTEFYIRIKNKIKCGGSKKIPKYMDDLDIMIIDYGDCYGVNECYDGDEDYNKFTFTIRNNPEFTNQSNPSYIYID